MRRTVKPLTRLLVALLCISPLIAKPKPTVPIYVQIHEGNGEIQTNTTEYSGVGSSGAGSYASTGSYSGATIFVNATVRAQTSENAPAVATNDGKWCLLGSSEIPLDPNVQYPGMLRGDGIDILVPQKNGKTKKIHFSVYDHAWKNLSEAMRLYKVQH